jgi:hypothetical protein
MGNWVFEMQEDARDMTFGLFVAKYGIHAAEVWQEVQFGDDRDQEPVFEDDYLEMDDGA